MDNKKPILKDKNGNLICDGDTIKKITNTDRGMFQGGTVKWNEKEGCFKCGRTVLIKDYMKDFIVVNKKKKQYESK